MTEPSARSWHASAPHPQTGQCVITNAQGRVVAIATNPADAEYICEAAQLADAVALVAKGAFELFYEDGSWRACQWHTVSDAYEASSDTPARAIIALAAKMRGG